MREPGAILLVACYELGHQPLAVAWPAAFLERPATRPPSWTSRSSPSTPRRRQARAGRDLGPHAHRPAPRRHRRRARPRGQPRLPPRASTASTRRLNADYLLDARRRLRDRRARRRGPLGGAGGRARGRRGHDRARSQTGAPAGPDLRRLTFPSRAARAAVAQEVRAPRARRPAGAGRLRRGEPRLPAPVPALSDPAGLRRAVLRRAARDRARRRPPAGGGRARRTSPSAIPISSTGPATRWRWRATLHAEFPDADLRLHREDRAPAGATARAWPSWPRLGCVFIVSAAESLSDTVLAHLDKGHTRADVVEALRAVRATRASPAADLGGVHPVDDARRLPRVLDFVEARGADRPRRPRAVLASACWSRPARCCSSSAAMRPLPGRARRGGLLLSRGRTPTPAMDRAARGGDGRWSPRRRKRREDAAVTFDRVRALADEAAGVAVARARRPVPPTGRARPGSPSRGSAERSPPRASWPSTGKSSTVDLIHSTR